MSHFTTLVITSNGSPAEAEALMAPFSESIVVAPYDAPCSCINQVAHKDAFRQAEKDFAHFDYRAFRAEHDKMSTEDFIVMWNKIFTGPFSQLVLELESKHPLCDKPNPDCPICFGSGTYKETYNPKSRWDWKLLGGRWDYVYREIQGALVSEFNHPELKTFAILTPDGEWLQPGELGWFATIHNPIDPDQWDSCYNATLEKYKTFRGLVYDCHI